MKRNASTVQQFLLKSRSTYVCWQCQQKRTISQGWLKKKEEGREEWATRAKEIRGKARKSMLTILKERGYVHAVTGDEKAVDRLMIDKRVGIYLGVDPTARSLHVGHMVAFMPLFWMYIHGFHALSLIGGSTARIGDPTGRTTDRPEMTPTERKANITAIHYQLKRLWVHVERMAKKHGYKDDKYWDRDIVNNAFWWGNTTFMDVLKTLGRGLRLGPMLTRDTVKTKMDSGDGMSFSEFCYPILQAWDWWHMYNTRGVQMQLGGADQFGNIVAGIDAIKYIAKNHNDPEIRQDNGVQELTTPYGITVPLLTTASGAKFGKSAGNAIWLDQDMTSCFDLYGFFVRTADADVERHLKLFTFLPLNEIQSLMAQHEADPSKRIPHHKLAFEFVDLVHGGDWAKKTEKEHRGLFQRSSLSTLTEPQPAKTNPLLQNQNPYTRQAGTFESSRLNKYAQQANATSSPAQHVILPKSLVYNQPVARVLFAAGMVTSRSEGHRLSTAGGAYVGKRSGSQMSDELSFLVAKVHNTMQCWDYMIRDNEAEQKMHEEGEEGLLILRIGKWKVRMARVVSDEKYESMGLEPTQAWTEMKASLSANNQEKIANAAIKEAKQAVKDAENSQGNASESKYVPPVYSVLDPPPKPRTIEPLPEIEPPIMAPKSDEAKARNQKLSSSQRPAESSTGKSEHKTKRDRENEAYSLQSQQGRLTLERSRLQQLNKAATVAGYRPEKKSEELNREDQFIAARLELQENYVKKLEADVKKRSGASQVPVSQIGQTEDHTAAATLKAADIGESREEAVSFFRKIAPKLDSSDEDGKPATDSSKTATIANESGGLATTRTSKDTKPTSVKKPELAEHRIPRPQVTPAGEVKSSRKLTAEPPVPSLLQRAPYPTFTPNVDAESSKYDPKESPEILKPDAMPMSKRAESPESSKPLHPFDTGLSHKRLALSDNKPVKPAEDSPSSSFRRGGRGISSTQRDRTSFSSRGFDRASSPRQGDRTTQRDRGSSSRGFDRSTLARQEGRTTQRDEERGSSPRDFDRTSSPRQEDRRYNFASRDERTPGRPPNVTTGYASLTAADDRSSFKRQHTRPDHQSDYRLDPRAPNGPLRFESTNERRDQSSIRSAARVPRLPSRTSDGSRLERQNGEPRPFEIMKPKSRADMTWKDKMAQSLAKKSGERGRWR